MDFEATTVLVTTDDSQGVITRTELAVGTFIGSIGVLGNCLVLFVLLKYQSSRKRICNLLVINQSLVDFISCVLLIITYVSRSIKKSYEGSRIWICLLIDDDMAFWVFATISTMSLMTITIERYLMVVHPLFYRNKISRKSLLVVIALGWLYGATIMVGFNIPFSGVRDGVCYLQMWLPSVEFARFYAVLATSSFFICPVFLFIICYGHMLLIITRRNKVLPAQTPSQSTAQKQPKISHAQLNLTKVMVIVSVCFTICWGPIYIHYVLLIIDIIPNLMVGVSAIYKFFTFLTFCNCCINPFIYAFKYDDFKKNLRKILFRKKAAVAGSITQTTNNSITL